MDDIMKELTDDFVECFSDPENQNGAMWRILGFTGMLPEGVNQDDERVIALVNKAKKYALIQHAPGTRGA